VPDPEAQRHRIRLTGTVPSAVSPPSGCPFHTRCPRKVGKICEEEAPPWRELGGEHRIWCHLPLSRGTTPYVAAQAGTTTISSMNDTEAGATLHA
jgi:peptide/nickel transport system ATP-binding protein